MSRLVCQRDQFEIPESAHYLNCAYMSPLATRVIEAGIRGIRGKALPTAITQSDFFDGANQVRERFGSLVNSPSADRIAIIPAASYAIATCARNLELASSQNIVLIDEQFPGNVYTWRALGKNTGAQLRTVYSPEGRNRGRGWNERILDTIDSSTAVVTLGSVHWTDGTLFDLKAIGDRAREVGAALIVDGTQSVGALPIDVSALQPDLLVVAGYKWLMGPYSIGCAYFGPRFDDGEPLEETWIARKGSENFAGLVDYEEEYQPGAIRYDVGERSNFALMPMLLEALDMILEWTPEGIQEYVTELTAPLLVQATALGYDVEDAQQRGGHLFGLRLPNHIDIDEVKTRCAERSVSVSQRGNSIRVSPHVYNTAADVDALIEALSIP